MARAAAAHFGRCAIGANRSKPFAQTFVPSHCKAPLLTAEGFLRVFAGRTLVFVGDSITLQQYTALLCTLLPPADGGDDGTVPSMPAWWRAEITVAEVRKQRACVPFAREVVLCLVTASKWSQRATGPLLNDTARSPVTRSLHRM